MKEVEITEKKLLWLTVLYIYINYIKPNEYLIFMLYFLFYFFEMINISLPPHIIIHFIHSFIHLHTKITSCIIYDNLIFLCLRLFKKYVSTELAKFWQSTKYITMKTWKLSDLELRCDLLFFLVFEYIFIALFVNCEYFKNGWVDFKMGFL